MWILYVCDEDVKGDDMLFDKKRCDDVFIWWCV